MIFVFLAVFLISLWGVKECDGETSAFWAGVWFANILLALAWALSLHLHWG